MRIIVKYVAIIIITVSAILIITNPSRSSFMDYVGESSYKGLKRESNFFLFSIYKQTDYTEGYSRYTRSHYYVDGDESEYLGIAGNFFHILPHKEAVISQPEQPAIDTAKTNSITLPPPSSITSWNKAKAQ